MRERILRSPQGGPSIPRAVKSQPIKPTNKISTPKSQYCSQKCESGKDSSSLLPAEECKRTMAQDCKTTIAHGRPYDSTSESDSITEDGTPAPRVAPVNLLRRSRYETSMRKKVVLNKNGEETFKRKKIIKTLGMEVSDIQDRVRTSSLNLRGGELEDSIQNSNLDTPCDDTTSSGSARSSGKLSEQKTGWTWTCSTCTESDSQQRDLSPPERPAKKNCGARGSREVPSMWNSMERLTTKRIYHSKGRIGESEESINVYEAGSRMRGEDKDLEDSPRYMSQERTHLQDRYEDEKQTADADKMSVQEPGRQTHAQSRLEISTKIIGPEQFHAEIAWIASSGSTRCPQQVLDHNDNNDKHDEVIKVKIEKGFNGVKTKEHVSHNRLRDSVEAVWKTSLGTKGEIENEDVDIERMETYLRNEDNLNVPLLREDSHLEKIQEKSSAQEDPEEDADDEVSAYKKAWRSIGTKKSGQDNFLEKEFSDPVFWCIQRDYQNLEALVAKEEDLQKDPSDPSVIQSALEREVQEAEHKSCFHEAEIEVEIEATEGAHAILNQRAAFHSKFKEELEQGVSDSLKLQESSHFNKLRFDIEESEVKDGTRNSLSAKGKRASPTREPRIDSKPTHTNPGPGKAQFKLMAESESRIAAEAKASYFEACAKAAEKRLHTLLDERDWYYKKFVEEVEYKNDMKRLQHLLELEKASHACQGQKKKLDVRLLVASSVTDEPLDEESKNDQGKIWRDVHDIGSCPFDQEDLLQGNEDGYSHRATFAKWEQELGKTMSDGKGLAHNLRGKIEESSDFHEDEGKFEESSTPQSSFPRFGDGDIRHEAITHCKTKPKNEKKRPLSLMNSPKLREAKPSELNESVKIDKCSVKGRSSFDFNESPRSHGDFMVATEASICRKEDTFEVMISSDPPLKSCEELPRDVDGKSLPLPTKWKMETKAELRKIIQEQEFTWKMAENSVDELARRLEVLENFKNNLQETLRRSRGTGNMDCLLSRLEKNLEDFPGGFNVLYSCPFFEEHDVESGINTESANNMCLSPKVSQISKDYEIQLLKAEISHLKNEISGRKINIDPQTEAFVTDRDLPCLSVDIEGAHLVPKAITTETKQDLPNDPFQEKYCFPSKEAPKSWTNSPRNIDPHVHCEDFTPIRQVRDLNGSNRSQTPHEDNRAKSAFPMIEGTNSKPRWMSYPNNFSKEGDHITTGNSTSNEGHFQDARTVVQQLSNIFSEQEAKFQSMSTSNEAPSESLETRTYYLELLKSLSQQLAYLCHGLFADSPSHQMCHEMESLDKKIDPATEAINAQYIGLQEEQTNDKLEPNTIATNDVFFRAQQSYTVIETPTSSFFAELENLRITLQEAERKLEEETKMSSSLIEKLEFQARNISEVKAEHVEELVEKDQRINFEQQLNMHLSSEVAKTEITLADFRSHSKGLVVDLDCRLQSARSEVKSLRDTILALKLDLDKKENLASSLKGERNKSQLQIQDLRRQIQMFQRETDAIVWEKEKLELVKSIKETRTNFEEQQHSIKEFVNINENLILVAQSKENEIRTLRKMATSLQQSVSRKSDETKRLLRENADMSQDVIKAKEVGENCKQHYEFLQSKLEEIEKDLKSREEAMERLTTHLGKTIEGQHFILEEKEQFLLLLNNALQKEQKLEDEVKDLKIVIRDLEQSLNSMDEEMNRIKVEMDKIKTTTMNAPTIERQTKELRRRVHQLEEEVMEKEGQITILTSSFP